MLALILIALKLALIPSFKYAGFTSIHKHFMPVFASNEVYDQRKIVYLNNHRAVTSTIKIAALILATAASPIFATSCNNSIVMSTFTIAEASDFIRKNCQQALSAVKSTGRLMYRGEACVIGGIKAGLLTSDYDLLFPSTFVATSPTSAYAIADYFKTLDETIKEINATALRPSQGHLATTSVMAASEWGPVCSVWPMGR